MSGNSSNKISVPQSKAAMDRFKMEVASEIGVPLKEGYNGDLTSAQAGSIGGEMVREITNPYFIDITSVLKFAFTPNLHQK